VGGLCVAGVGVGRVRWGGVGVGGRWGEGVGGGVGGGGDLWSIL